MTTRTARQLYFAFVFSRISYGIEVYGNCANRILSKLQIIQNKLLKLILQRNIRTPTNTLHRNLHLLKVKDIQNVRILLFVNKCLLKTCPIIFQDYYHERVLQYDFRNPGLFIHRARTTLGSQSVLIYGAKLWNNLDDVVKSHRNKQNFKKHLISHYINQYVEL